MSLRVSSSLRRSGLRRGRPVPPRKPCLRTSTEWPDDNVCHLTRELPVCSEQRACLGHDVGHATLPLRWHGAKPTGTGPWLFCFLNWRNSEKKRDQPT